MLFDQFDRRVVVLRDADDGHVGVGRQGAGNTVPHQQRILCDDDRNMLTHVAAVPPRSVVVLSHDRCRKPSMWSLQTILSSTRVRLSSELPNSVFPHAVTTTVVGDRYK